MVLTQDQGISAMYNGKVQQGPVAAPWAGWTKDEEKQRLEVIARRMAFKQATIGKLLAERRQIMRRAIRRMRRAEGKE